MSKEVKYSALNLYNNPAFATHAITGTINDSTHKEFRDFLKKVLEDNQKIDQEDKEQQEKEDFNKIHDPDAKPQYKPTKTKVQRINLIIDSYGGDCGSMTSIVALMNSCPIPIDTYCFGKAMSAGFMIFVHGKRRYVSEAVDLMTHSLSAGVWDNAPTIQQRAEHLMKMNKIYQSMISKRTNLSEDWFKENETKDVHFLAENCIEHNIADVIIKD